MGEAKAEEITLDSLFEDLELDKAKEMATEKSSDPLATISEEILSELPAGQVTIPRDADANFITSFLTKIFGRQPTEDQVDTALRELKNQPDQWAGSKHAEPGWPQGAPIKGEEGTAPGWMKFLMGPQEDVRMGLQEFKPQKEDFLRYANIETEPPSYLQSILNESKQDIRFLKALEPISPGITNTTIGNNLMVAYNEANDTNYSVDQFEIAFTEDGTATFLDPQTKQRTSFNKFVPEWNDISQYWADAIPFLYMGAGTVVGAGAATLTGGTMAGPLTVLMEGAGAYAGELHKRYIGLRKAGWRPLLDGSGYVNPSVVSNEITKQSELTEEQISGGAFIGHSDLYKSAMKPALWALGGSIAFRGLWHISRGVTARAIAADAGIPYAKSSMLKMLVKEDDFLNAMDNYASTQFGQTLNLAQEGASAGQVYRAYANQLLKESDDLAKKGFEAEARDLRKKAVEVNNTAEQILKQEAMFGSETTGAIGTLKAHQESSLNKLFADEMRIDFSKIDDPNYLAKLGISADEVVLAQSNKKIEFIQRDLFNIENNLQKEYDTIMRNATSLEEAMGKIQLLNDKVMKASFRANKEGYDEIGTQLANRTKGKVKIFNIDDKELINSIKNLSKEFKVLTPSAIDLTEKKILGDLHKNILKLEAGGTFDYATIQNTIRLMKNLKNTGKLPEKYDNVINALIGVRKNGLKVFDTKNGTNFAEKIGLLDDSLKSLSGFWNRGFINKIVQRNPGVGFKIDDPKTIFRTMLPANATKEHVSQVLNLVKKDADFSKALKDGILREWQDTVLTSVKDGVPSRLPKKSDFQTYFGITHKQPDHVVIGNVKYQIDPSKHTEFMSKHANAINGLFSKKEIKNFADAGSLAKSLQTQIAKSNELINKINNFPWGKGITLKDLGSGNLLFQKFIEKGSPKDVSNFLKMVKSHYTLADGNLAPAGKELITGVRQAAYNHLLNKSGGTWDEFTGVYRFSIDGMQKSLKNNDFYALAFGEGNIYAGRQHLNNMNTILKAMKLVQDRGMKGGEPPSAFPFFTDGNVSYEIIRWAVGVLNRRARALTGARRTLGKTSMEALEEALADPVAAAYFIRMMKKSYTEKEAMSILGNQFGLHLDDIKEGRYIWGDLITDEQLEIEGLRDKTLPRKEGGGTIRKWAEGLDKMFNMPSEEQITDFFK